MSAAALYVERDAVRWLSINLFRATDSDGNESTLIHDSFVHRLTPRVVHTINPLTMELMSAVLICPLWVVLLRAYLNTCNVFDGALVQDYTAVYVTRTRSFNKESDNHTSFQVLFPLLLSTWGFLILFFKTESYWSWSGKAPPIECSPTYNEPNR